MVNLILVFALMLGSIFLFIVISCILLVRRLFEDDKCEHWLYCKWYQKDSPPCNEDGGYYNPEHPAGCCQGWDEKIKKRKAGIEWKKEE